MLSTLPSTYLAVLLLSVPSSGSCAGFQFPVAAMAQDLHLPPSPPAFVPTNGVRLCEARLDKGDPCNRPTKGTQYRYCPPHYKVYKERTEEYKAQSWRVLQMKNQARVRVCVRPGAAKATLNVADVDADIALLEEWRAGIEEEVRMRERHTVQFFDGIGE